MRKKITENRVQRTEKNRKSLVPWCTLLVLILAGLLLLPQATQAAAPVARDISAKLIKDTQNSTLNTLTLQASDADADTLSYTLLSLPSYGQLKEGVSGQDITTVPYALTSDKLKFIPEPGFTGQDSFTYQASDGSSSSNIATVTINVTEWFAPIGIPEPSFGITTTHMMYADPSYTYDYGNGPEPYRIGPDGPYTHYVDPGHPNATDTNNPYGTHTKPRITRPNSIANLSAGSVMEMHSGLQPGVGPIYGSGTPSKPIFIRGVPGDEPTFKSVFSIVGDYIVMENLKFDLETYARKTITIGWWYEGARTHIAIRGCEFYNGMYDPDQSYQVIRILHNFDSSTQVKNIVIYNNHFHNIGDGRTTPVKNDAVGVSVDTNAENIWIVDNYMHHLGGDGVQVAYDSYSANSIIPNHIYIGRNTFHDNYENAIDLKVCEDVIVSQNIAYNFGEEYSDVGGGSPFRYGTDARNRKNIWTIFNEAYNSSSPDGAFLSYSSEVQPFADEIYYIGNIVHDCHNTEGTASAFVCWNQQHIYFSNNIAYNCDKGGGFWITNNDNPNESLTLINNIFAESGSGIRGYLVIGTKTQGPSDFANLTTSNNLFYQHSGPGKLSFYEWYAPRARLEYIEYTIDEFKQAKPGKAQGIIEANPNFVDAINGDFYLQSNSPAIDAGTVHDYFDRFYNLYGININVDFDGNPITDGKPDIGAYEYVPQGALLYGDVSGDGEISAYDAALTAQAAVGLITLTPEQTRKADVNADSEVSAYDAALIAQRAVGLIDVFPGEG